MKYYVIYLCVALISGCANIVRYTAPDGDAARVRFQTVGAPGNVEFNTFPELTCGRHPIGAMRRITSVNAHALPESVWGLPARLGIPGGSGFPGWRYDEKSIEAGHELLLSVSGAYPTGLNPYDFAYCSVIAKVQLSAGKDYEIEFLSRRKNCSLQIKEVQIDPAGSVQRLPVAFETLTCKT